MSRILTASALALSLVAGLPAAAFAQSYTAPAGIPAVTAQGGLEGAAAASNLQAKHTLLLAGIGWGSMPAHMVQADLAAGRLVELHMPEAKHRRLPFTAIYRTDRPPGLAGRWLIQRFAGQAADEPMPTEGRPPSRSFAVSSV